MCTTGRAAQVVAGFTFWGMHVGVKNIKTCALLLEPGSGQLPFLGLTLACAVQTDPAVLRNGGVDAERVVIGRRNVVRLLGKNSRQG